jgi:hypothetical protein
MCYPGLAGGTFRAGQRLDSEHCTNFCDYNGLGCLPVANGATGAQRFLAALSNRGTHHGPHLLTRSLLANRARKDLRCQRVTFVASGDKALFREVSKPQPQKGNFANCPTRLTGVDHHPFQTGDVMAKNLLKCWPSLSKEEHKIIEFAARNCGPLQSATTVPPAHSH